MKNTDIERKKLKRPKNKFNIASFNLPARSSLYFTATNLLCKGAAFIFTPIFTRLLTSAEYGEYSLFSSYLSVAIVIVSLELPGGVIMRAFQKEKELHHLSLISAAIISVILSLPTVFALMRVKLITGGGMSFPFAYIFLLFSIISLSVINLYVSKCKFLYKWIPSLIIAITQSIAAPIISIALIRVNYFKNMHHVATKIGTVTTVLVIIAIFISLICIKNAHEEVRNKNMSKAEIFKFIKRTQKFLLSLALPLLPYYFSIMLISQSDKLLISEFFGKSVLAKYSVAYSAGIALTAITGGILGALSPWIMRKVRAGEFERIKSALNSMISLAVSSVILFLCVAPDVFNLLAPKEYSDALPVLFIISLVPIPLTLTQCMSSVAIAKEKTRGVLLSGLIPAVITVALNFLLIKNRPIYTPAIITAGGFFILMTLSIFNIKKIIGKSPINVNKTFQKLLLLIFISAVVFAFRHIIAIRIFIASLAILSILYMLKDTFLLLKEKDAA